MWLWVRIKIIEVGPQTRNFNVRYKQARLPVRHLLAPGFQDYIRIHLLLIMKRHSTHFKNTHRDNVGRYLRNFVCGKENNVGIVVPFFFQLKLIRFRNFGYLPNVIMKDFKENVDAQTKPIYSTWEMLRQNEINIFISEVCHQPN